MAYDRVGDGIESVGGNISRRQCAEQRSVGVDDRHRCHIALLHGAPCPVESSRRLEDRRLVKINIAHLSPHVLDSHRLFKTESYQQSLGLITQVVKTAGDVIPVSCRIAESRIGHGGDDRIRIGIPVTYNIYFTHDNNLSQLS